MKRKERTDRLRFAREAAVWARLIGIDGELVERMWIGAHDVDAAADAAAADAAARAADAAAADLASAAARAAAIATAAASATAAVSATTAAYAAAAMYGYWRYYYIIWDSAYVAYLRQIDTSDTQHYPQHYLAVAKWLSEEEIAAVDACYAGGLLRVRLDQSGIIAWENDAEDGCITRAMAAQRLD